MTKLIRNILFLFTVLTVCSSWKEPRKFSFVDKFENTISIENIYKLPKHLDTTFFKSNLTGLHFNQKLTESSLRFEYIIFEVKTIKKSKEYELRVLAVPETNDPLIQSKYENCIYYRLTIKKVNNVITLEKVGFLYYEI
jgi:hypothetical protein